MMVVSITTNTECSCWPFRRCYCSAVSVERVFFFFSIDYFRIYRCILFFVEKTCALALRQIKACVLDDEETQVFVRDV